MDGPSIPRPRVAERRHSVVLSFDIRRFSDFTDSERTRVSSEFRDDIEGAFEDAGLLGVWNAWEFCQNTGDGLVVGFDEAHLRSILDGVPRALQDRLRKRYLDGGTRIRMRVGVAAGPIDGIEDSRVDVAPGQVVIDACRICDAKPTRMLLENSDDKATFLAVAVTAHVITGTIGPNPSRIRAGEFVRVPIDMADKQYHAEAYLHVPSPSGDLLRFGLANLPASRVSEDAAFEPLESVVAKGFLELRPTTGGQVAGVGAVGHDLRTEAYRFSEFGADAIGAGSGSDVRVDRSKRTDLKADRVGNVFHGEVRADGGGTVNAVGGDQHNGDQGSSGRSGRG